MLGSVRDTDVHHTTTVYEFGTRFICTGVFSDGVKWAYEVEKDGDAYHVGGCVGVFLTDDTPTLETMQPAAPYSHPRTRTTTSPLQLMTSATPKKVDMFDGMTSTEVVRCAVRHMSATYYKALLLEDKHTFVMPYNVMGKQQRSHGDIARALPPQPHECIMHVVTSTHKPPIELGITYSEKTIASLQRHGDVHYATYGPLHVIHVMKEGKLRKDTYQKVLKCFIDSKQTTLRLAPLDTPRDSYESYGLALHTFTRRERDVLDARHVGVCVYADSALGEYVTAGFRCKCSVYPYAQTMMESVKFPQLVEPLYQFARQLESTMVLPLRTTEEWQPVMDAYLTSTEADAIPKTLSELDANKPLKRQFKKYVDRLQEQMVKMEADVPLAVEPHHESTQQEAEDAADDNANDEDGGNEAKEQEEEEAHGGDHGEEAQATESNETLDYERIKTLADEMARHDKQEQDAQEKDEHTLENLNVFVNRNHLETMHDIGLFHALDHAVHGVTSEESVHALRHQLADYIQKNAVSSSVMRALLPAFHVWERNEGKPMAEHSAYLNDFFKVTQFSSAPDLDTLLPPFCEAILTKEHPLLLPVLEDMLHVRCVVLYSTWMSIPPNLEPEVVYLRNANQLMHLHKKFKFTPQEVEAHLTSYKYVSEMGTGKKSESMLA